MTMYVYLMIQPPYFICPFEQVYSGRANLSVCIEGKEGARTNLYRHIHINAPQINCNRHAHNFLLLSQWLKCCAIHVL